MGVFCYPVADDRISMDMRDMGLEPTSACEGMALLEKSPI